MCEAVQKTGVLSGHVETRSAEIDRATHWLPSGAWLVANTRLPDSLKNGLQQQSQDLNVETPRLSRENRRQRGGLG